MKLARDVAAAELIRALGRVGCTVSRQSGSPVQLTLADAPQHHVTVPAHSPLTAGTLGAILGEVVQRLGCGRAGLLQRWELQALPRSREGAMARPTGFCSTQGVSRGS